LKIENYSWGRVLESMFVQLFEMEVVEAQETTLDFEWF
jgi:hypothetical protein